MAEELASGIGATHPDYALLQDLLNDYDLQVVQSLMNLTMKQLE